MPAQVERTPAPVFHAKPTVFTGPKPSKAPELDGPEPPSEGRDRELSFSHPPGAPTSVAAGAPHPSHTEFFGCGERMDPVKTP